MILIPFIKVPIYWRLKDNWIKNEFQIEYSDRLHSDTRQLEQGEYFTVGLLLTVLLFKSRSIYSQ